MFSLAGKRVSFRSGLFDFHEVKGAAWLVQPNRNNPNTLFYQSSDKCISTLDLTKDDAHSRNVLYKHSANVLAFGHLIHMKQFWVMSVLQTLSFVNDESGRTLKTWAVSKPVLECHLVLKTADNLLLWVLLPI